MDLAFFEDSPGQPRPWGSEPQPEPPPAPPAREPVFNAPWPAVLIAAVILVGYGLQGFAPEPLVAAGVFSPRDLADGRGWSAVTALFLHGTWGHALMNAAFALAFGTPVARFFGVRARGAACFFGFYLATGVIANLGYAAVHPGAAMGLVGASGAVSGLMGAAARLIGGRGRVGPIFSQTTLSFGGALLAMSLLIAVFGSSLVPGTGGAGIAWEAHLAGFAAGVLLIGPFAWLAWRR